MNQVYILIEDAVNKKITINNLRQIASMSSTRTHTHSTETIASHRLGYIRSL